MTQELMYTSAPQGLKPGSRGFCTVVITQGMPINLAERLESLSGYRHVFQPSDPRAAQNPIVFSHLRLTVGGQLYHVLSRICPAGVDYSQRANKFAHHVVLHPSELPAVGPAWLLAAPGFMATSWDGRARVIASGRPVPHGQVVPAPCDRWRDLTGDAGWAGLLLGSAMGKPPQPVIMVFQPSMEMLPLIAEVLALLPPERRWNVTFSTYYTGLPAGIDCLWRCVLEGTPEAAAARRTRGATVIDLCQRLGAPPESEFVEAARQGQAIRLPAAPTVPGLAVQLRMEAPSDGPATALLPRTDVESHHRPSVYSAAPSPLSDELPVPPKVRPYGMTPKRRRRWPLIAAGIAAAALLLVGAGVAFWMASEGRLVGLWDHWKTHREEKSTEQDQKGSDEQGKPSNTIPNDAKTAGTGNGEQPPAGGEKKPPVTGEQPEKPPASKPPGEKTEPDPPKTNTGQAGPGSSGAKLNGDHKGPNDSPKTEKPPEKRPEENQPPKEDGKPPPAPKPPDAESKDDQHSPKDFSATSDPPKKQPKQSNKEPDDGKPKPKDSPEFIVKYVELTKPPKNFSASPEKLAWTVEILIEPLQKDGKGTELSLVTPPFVDGRARSGEMFRVERANDRDPVWRVRLVAPPPSPGQPVATLQCDAGKLSFSWESHNATEQAYEKLVSSVLIARMKDRGEHVVQFIKPHEAKAVDFKEPKSKKAGEVLLQAWEAPAAWNAQSNFKLESINLQAELTVRRKGNHKNQDRDYEIEKKAGRALKWDVKIRQTGRKFSLSLDWGPNPDEAHKLILTAADADVSGGDSLFRDTHPGEFKLHQRIEHVQHSINDVEKRIKDCKKQVNEKKQGHPPTDAQEKELKELQEQRDSLLNLKQSLEILGKSTIQIKEVYYEFSPNQNSDSSSQEKPKKEEPKKYRVYLIAEPGHEIFRGSQQRQGG